MKCKQTAEIGIIKVFSNWKTIIAQLASLAMLSNETFCGDFQLLCSLLPPYFYRIKCIGLYSLSQPRSHFLPNTDV